MCWYSKKKNAIVERKHLWSAGAFRDLGVGAGAGLGNFWKNRVQVQRDLTIKKLFKIFLKNILLCLDSQNKERRRQETHFYASEVGISAVLARGKADFDLFWPFRSPVDTTRYGRYGPIQRESNPNWHESSQVSTNLRKKRKKINSSDVAPTRGQPRRTPCQAAWTRV